VIQGQEDEIGSLKQTVRQLESEKLEQRNVKSGNAREKNKSKEMMMVEQSSSGKNSLDFNLQQKSGGQQPNQKEVVDTRSSINGLT
jgi:hypothetical protein